MTWRTFNKGLSGAGWIGASLAVGGVDALLRTQTRDHKDLDVLLPLASLEGSMTLLAEEGFRLAYAWEENLDMPGHHPLLGTPMPSAFVLSHDDEREVDVHVYNDQGSAVSPLWDTHRTLQPRVKSVAWRFAA